MFKNLNIFGLLKNRELDFKPYYEKENDFKRLSIIHSIAAVVIAPLFSLFVYNTEISPVYFYISLGYSVLFPIYIAICWFIPSLRNKLIYFFILHLFGMTYFAFIDLIENNFRLLDLFSFFSLYALVIFVIQRLYPCLIYTIYVMGLLLYGFQFVDEAIEISKTFIFSFFGILGASGILVLYSRERMINSVEDYAQYLRKLMQNPKIGYILFQLDGEKKYVNDFNEEFLRFLRIKNHDEQEIADEFFNLLSESDMNIISRLAINETFTKTTLLDKDITVEITVSILSLKNGFFWLARLTDITKRIKEKDELMIREEKYRNLYNKNQAGVFTLDRATRLVDFNDTFFSMFEETFNIGDLFINEQHLEEWEELYEIITNRENLKNYQTHVTLKTGQVKWFVFNYFYDLKTGLIEGTVVDVTEVQKAAIALRQSEEKYRLIYEESNDAILLLDGDNIIDVNRRGIQLFGMPQDQLLECTLWDLTMNQSPELEKKYKKIKQRLHSSRNTKFDWVFRGNLHHIEAEVAIVELIIGEKLYYQCVIQDVTEKNETMRALEENRKSFQSILENTPEGILIVTESEILYANKEVYHLTEDDTIHLDRLFISEDQLRFEELIQQQRADKGIYQDQLTLLNAKGSTVIVDVTMVTTNFSQTEATLIIFKDVSLLTKLSKEMLRAELAEETNKKLEKEIKERIRAERELENLFLKTKAIYDSSSNTLLITLNLNNLITSFNSHCEKYFYHLINKRLALGDHVSDYFSAIYNPRELRYFELLLQKVKAGASHQIESRFVINERIYWIELFINPIFDTEGRVAEISMVAHDITEKKKSEEEIVESLKEKEVLLKEIHHRVKNNLQVISSILNLQSSFVHDDKTLDLLQESRNRIRSMAIIHENLYRTTNFSSIDFAGYILNLATNLSALYKLGETDTELVYELEPIDLVLDQAVPCGLLLNELITNALKYAFPNGEKGRIRIALKEHESTIYLEVQDNGIGLPQDFEIEKSDTLGLQLVLTLVEQLDGVMAFKSEGGTEFLIKFEKTKI